MVPHYKRALFHSFFDGVNRVILFEFVDIFNKQGVQVTDRFFAGNFSAFNHNKTDGFPVFHPHFVRFIEIRISDILKRTIFNVIRNRNCIQAIAPGFVYTHHWSYLSVGENCMGMKITF
ncbi:hypothetical protein SDC9_180718 [bioreactor metagenome]|uniref:Uncharacterized protein n=1 Tax=bioreactor metagenome TaxID=1076179 RepID=A0A645HAV2_9ZZZZ